MFRLVPHEFLFSSSTVPHAACRRAHLGGNARLAGSTQRDPH
ncbi:MAG: hypothetical protein WCC36_09565 [Gammaproteobacteria bacterium]